ncbi:hypothetical protein JHD46_07200 [Sulfurimonas sp. SAG-AH-194-C20]|nr:hypothetical protein [Sulfurimonas sp. SAG-AH-194-C20]MDF1879420.1 hypothetical protein [Sulfurimonas sp. SAG-AH-194-C20]
MKKINLTQEEQETSVALENDEFVSLEGEELLSMKASLKLASTNTIEKLSKRKSISIRLLEDDIERLKAKAINLGMPYQTLISSTIHQYSHGDLDRVV